MFTSPYPEDAAEVGHGEPRQQVNRKGPGEVQPEQVGVQPAAG